MKFNFKIMMNNSFNTTLTIENIRESTSYFISSFILIVDLQDCYRNKLRSIN